MKNVKLAAIALVAALGIGSAATAQQSGGSMAGMTPEQHRQMMSDSGQKGHGGMKMGDAEMGKMMENCRKMMQSMGEQSAQKAPAAPKR